MSQSKTIWVVTTGEAGNVSQAVGLAEGIGLPFSQKVGSLSRLWRVFPTSVSYRAGFSRLLSPVSDTFAPPWPEVVIACGRRSAALSLAIREAALKDGQARPFLVQILNPQINLSNFDLVIAPDHDRLAGDNVITTLGAMHRLTGEKLEAGAEEFKGVFKDLPRPLIAVLIGGTSGRYRFGIQDARRFADLLETLVVENGVGVVITTSRRTGEDEAALMRKALGELPGVWFWDGKAPNPYFGMLALADIIMVTEESVSMISEACFTGKPVYTLGLNGGSVKFTRFHERMEEEGYARPYTGELGLWKPPAPLNEAVRVGAIVREKAGLS